MSRYKIFELPSGVALSFKEWRDELKILLRGAGMIFIYSANNPNIVCKPYNKNKL